MQAVAATAASSGIPAGIKRAEDMEPEEWRGLVGGLLEFLSEEAAEPEHAAIDGWTADASFSESDHPRAPDGKFGLSASHPSGGGKKFTAKSKTHEENEAHISSLRKSHPDYNVTVNNEKSGMVHTFKPSEKYNKDFVGDAAMGSDDGPHAAGTVFMDPNGTVLLIKRSDEEENFAGHWALPGGGVEAGETPEQGAAREAKEELGGTAPDGERTLLSKNKTPTGMTFHTFHQAVPKQFKPTLNDEHTDHVWAKLDNLPEPIHPRVAETLKALSDRMGTDDWQESKHPRSGGKFTSNAGSESASGESEHDLADYGGRYEKGKPGGGSGWSAQELADYGDKALRVATDSALKLALDKDTARSLDKDGRMHVETANISKANICPYVGNEIPGWENLGLDPNKIYKLLRDPDELKKGAATFNAVQLLKRHVPVNADDHRAWDIVGTTGTDAKFEEPYLTNSLHVWSQDGINLIKSEAQKELSCGYHYDPDMTPGSFEGQHYDGVMRNIVGNHVALVKDGRAGDDVVVTDGLENVQWAVIEQAIREMA